MTPRAPTRRTPRPVVLAVVGVLAGSAVTAGGVPAHTTERPIATTGAVAPTRPQPAPRWSDRRRADEVDRVMAASRPVHPGAPLRDRVAALVRCADLEGERYCLTAGWTTRTEREVERDLVAAVRAEGGVRGGTATGDLSATALVAGLSRTPTARRESAERRELRSAVAALAKVHRVRASIGQRPRPVERGSILRPSRVRQQQAGNWCGPATMQMIHWGQSGAYRQPQWRWRQRLGTGPPGGSGTSITAMVDSTNRHTDWDRPRFAGRYVAFDVSGLSFDDWWLMHVRHYQQQRAPIILHPNLWQQYFPYLDEDGVGHFQVGRGWDWNWSDNPNQRLLGFFEPYNQRRFDPTERFIPRVQWQPAGRMYQANLVHYQHNMGI